MIIIYVFFIVLVILGMIEEVKEKNRSIYEQVLEIVVSLFDLVFEWVFFMDLGNKFNLVIEFKVFVVIFNLEFL